MASGDDAEYAQMQARFRQLTEPIAGPPPRHWQASRIRGELQAPATAREHAASDQIGAAKKLPRLRSPGRRAPRTAIASDPDWQALDQLDEVGQRIVGELEAMQTATEPAARDVPSSSGRQGQATVDKRVESIEKLTKEQMAMQTATEPAARDVPSSSDRQATVWVPPAPSTSGACARGSAGRELNAVGGDAKASGLELAVVGASLPAAGTGGDAFPLKPRPSATPSPLVPRPPAGPPPWSLAKAADVGGTLAPRGIPHVILLDPWCELRTHGRGVAAFCTLCQCWFDEFHLYGQRHSLAFR